MRVLHVFTVPVTRNGITMFALQRLPGLRAAGAAVGFVAPGEVEPSLRAEIEAAGARLYVLPQKRPGLGYVRARRFPRAPGKVRHPPRPRQFLLAVF